MKNKVLKYCFLAGVAAMSISACTVKEGDGGSTSDGEIIMNITDDEIKEFKKNPISISFWSPITGPDSAYFQNIIKTWNDTYGQYIKVNSDPLDEEAHYTRILTSFKDNSTADITLIHKQRLARYYRTGRLRDMTSIVSNAGLSKSQYVDGAWDAGIYDNKMYALTLDYIPTLLYYNRKLIPEGYSEADILSGNFTYEKMCEMAAAAYVHSPVSSKRVFGFAFNYGFCEEPFISNLYSLGGKAVDSSNPKQPLYNDAKSLEAVKAIESIPFTKTSDGYKMASESGADHRKVFKAAKALFTIDGLWSTTSLVFHNENVDTGITYMPSVNSTSDRVTYSDSHMFVCFNNKNTSDARDKAISLFLKYYVNNDLYWCKSGKVAARTVTAENDEYSALEWGFVSTDSNKVIVPENIYSYQTITSHAAETISEICEGKGNDHTRYTDEEIQSMLDNSVTEAINLVNQL